MGFFLLILVFSSFDIFQMFEIVMFCFRKGYYLYVYAHLPSDKFAFVINKSKKLFYNLCCEMVSVHGMFRTNTAVASKVKVELLHCVQDLSQRTPV